MFDYASKLINSEIDEAIPKMVEMHFAKYCYFKFTPKLLLRMFGQIV